jgi:hypothetical protein
VVTILYAQVSRPNGGLKSWRGRSFGPGSRSVRIKVRSGSICLSDSLTGEGAYQALCLLPDFT